MKNIFLLLLAPLAFAGCTATSATLPARSASEQLLISYAADRAIARMECLDKLNNRKVYVDTWNFEAYDKGYALVSLQSAISDAGGKLVDRKDEAEIILDAGAAALSIDESEWLLGIPSLQVPVPLVGAVNTPELALLKNKRTIGKARLRIFAYSADTREMVIAPKPTLGSAKIIAWQMLFVIKFTNTDLPDFPKESKTSGR
jgi:hypothetical protein